VVWLNWLDEVPIFWSCESNNTNRRTKIKVVRLYCEWSGIDGCQKMEKESKGCSSEGGTGWTTSISSISHWRSRSNANPYLCNKKCFPFQRHSFLTSAVDKGDWSASRHGRFTSEKNPGTYWVRYWVGSGGGLDIFWEDKYLLPLAWFEPWIIQVVA
jgi:hypothetical protein